MGWFQRMKRTKARKKRRKLEYKIKKCYSKPAKAAKYQRKLDALNAKFPLPGSKRSNPAHTAPVKPVSSFDRELEYRQKELAQHQTMITCKYCGARNSDDSLFCDYCGTRLKTDTPKPAVSTTPKKPATTVTKPAPSTKTAPVLAAPKKPPVAAAPTNSNQTMAATSSSRWEKRLPLLERMASELSQHSGMDIVVYLNQSNKLDIKISYHDDGVKLYYLPGTYSIGGHHINFSSFDMGRLPLAEMESFARFFTPILLQHTQRQVNRLISKMDEFRHIVGVHYQFTKPTTQDNRCWEQRVYITRRVNDW